ncbi:MAG: HEXXH motif-containing putative peptide modification protein [Arenicellales bacterium]
MAAVARVLESDHPIGAAGQRAITALRQFDAFPAETSSWLTGEPYAYLWGRLAYELLATVLRPGSAVKGAAEYYCRIKHLEPRQALVRHLLDVERLLIAAAVLEGGDLELEKPLVATAPFALPGTASSLEGQDRIVIHGVRSGRLQTEGDGETMYPTLGYGGGRWRMQPAVFNVPVSGIPEDVWTAGEAFQERHASSVESALGILGGLGSGMLDQIREGLRVIALRPEGAPGDLTNMSHCDLPGAISISPSPHPYELANIIWHEFLHNRLFALEEEGRFLDQSAQASDDRIYSPWRTDYRPMHGLLHAVYVFTGVGRYWLSVAGASDTPPPVRELAGTRVLRGLCQVRMGLALLRRHARLTEHGGRLLQALEHEHEALWRSASEAGLPPDLPHMTFRRGTPFDVETHEQTVREQVRTHLHRHAQAEHARYLEPLLSRPSSS